MKRLLASICLFSLFVPALCRADETRLDLKGKTIKLSVLGVAGWLPSKLPYEMGPEFAKFAKEKYGYDVSFTYADAPFSTLFQKAASSLATKSNEYSLIVSDSQWLGAFTEPGWIVKLDDVIKKNPELDIKWFDPVLESSYQEYPNN
jgi:multiple sugar transport system substrate-binding protein